MSGSLHQARARTVKGCPPLKMGHVHIRELAERSGLKVKATEEAEVLIGLLNERAKEVGLDETFTARQEVGHE